ncbi:LamG domain-containing protein [Aquisphaera insulae]|uniref:LamG domain-containing protein n=1 Tax=Aquisphaera insulae TaxID=2712864 RepID=UPI0013EBBF3B|nr:LamG domain-containing protein [Aquisphaera insulae]
MSSKIRHIFALSISLALGTATFNPARGALIHEWNFNNVVGSTVFDSAGSLNGTIVGGATIDPGAGVGGSAALEVSPSHDGYVDFGNVLPMTSGSFSFQVWVKTNSAGLAGGKHHSGFWNGYFMGIDNNGGAYFYAGGFTSGSSNAVVTDGLWHQLVGVYDTTANATSIYVDGKLESSAPRASIQGNDADFIIGGINIAGTNGRTFNGLLDNVSIFNSSLTAAQVRELYASQVVPEPASASLLGMGIAATIGLFRLRGRAKA